MKPINHTELAKFGVFIPQVRGFLDDHELEMDYSIAMDAMPALVSTSNAGIPAFLTNYLDPEVIEILFTPNKAVKILSEVKKGDWTTQTAMFPLVESTGEVSSYGDYNTNGSTNANINWVDRQSYLYQTITQWGELELEREGEAKINTAQQLNIASVKIMNKFENNSYFFGIAGLLNFGLLNDPSLPPSITPTIGAGGNTWALKTAAEIYNDIVALYEQMVIQTQGLIDRETKFVLATTPAAEANFTKTNQYNVNVSDQIKKNFPNLRIETATQYGLAAGNLVQLIAEDLEGNQVGYAAFSEKLRAHPIKVDLSSFQQKKTGGTWGAIIRYPIAFASLLGV